MPISVVDFLGVVEWVAEHCDVIDMTAQVAENKSGLLLFFFLICNLAYLTACVSGRNFNVWDCPVQFFSWSRGFGRCRWSDAAVAS